LSGFALLAMLSVFRRFARDGNVGAITIGCTAFFLVIKMETKAPLFFSFELEYRCSNGVVRCPNRVR
jgi:hypothetical protein